MDGDVLAVFSSLRHLAQMADRMLDPRLTRRSNAAAIDAGLSIPPRLSVEQVAERVIADCGCDPRAAVAELVAIVGALFEENRALAEAASPGYARGLLRR
jgi:hypothetical protein